jgi:methylated-DNA-[protein]-cysteine S-methyltransferase
MRTTIDKRLKNTLQAEYIEQDSEVLQESKKQLQEYFDMQRKEFDIPLLLVGTEFQKRVWHELIKVPYGTTISYQELADHIDHSKAVRAVANSNGANAIGIIVPCHRVIASDGSLGGYGGGIALKKRLLKIEGGLFAS